MQPKSISLAEQPASPKPSTPAAIYFAILIWMFAVILVYLLRFGPSEFWLLTKRIGINDKLVEVGSWLQPLFTANYLSP